MRIDSQSIRSFSRARIESQRGFVLVAALVLAVLYFMLMELMNLESQRALAEAQRFRARVVAATLAENAAELACVQMVTRTAGNASAKDEQGTMTGHYQRTAIVDYVVDAEGESGGVVVQKATVRLQGRVNGTQITIDYATHSQ
jgi:hypothetical protein